VNSDKRTQGRFRTGGVIKMNLWETRDQALIAIKTVLRQQAEVIQDAFTILDLCIERLSALSRTNQFAEVCGLTFIKVRNLALACYSLALDGLAQEAGAVFRVLAEGIELLIYFEQEPSRIDKAIKGKLPSSAGEIGKKIKGNFQPLRSFLNESASHFSYTPDSLNHLRDKSGNWKVIQPHQDTVLAINMHWLFVLFLIISNEEMLCLSQVNALDDGLVAKIEDWRVKGQAVFKTQIPHKFMAL
jgi:hypothetical protein